MDLKDSRVQGGVIIIHKIHEGKHQYEVEKVVKQTKATGEKMFVRSGDKLMQINGVDLQGLPPEDLAQMLAEGNPMLTVHKVSKMKIKDETPSHGDILHPVSKLSTFLNFTMEMMREDDDEKEGGEGRGDEGVEDEDCLTGTEENGEKQDMLIVTMTKTSISVVTGRGCDAGSPCEGCQGRGCTFHDVVMVSESSTVTLVPRGGSSFRQADHLNAAIEHVATHQYLRGLCSQKTLYASQNPEKITIYYYKSNIMERPFRGIPVVLNFTDSNCFLRCYKEGERVFLQVETCKKETLRQISTTDESKLAFVFYMKSDPLKQMRFESALLSGWFIQMVDTGSVTMETMDGKTEEHTFLFVIRKDSAS